MKKIFVCLLSFIAVIMISNMRFDEELFAKSTDIYYGVGDVFKDTGKDSFLMGGQEWKIGYTDQTTAKSLIYTDWEPTWLKCGIDFGVSNVDQCFTDFQTKYTAQSNMNDALGNKIKTEHSLNTLKLMSIDQYMKMSNNETDNSLFQRSPGIYTFLDEKESSGKFNLVIRAMKPCSGGLMKIYGNTQYVCYIEKGTRSVHEGLVTVFEIDAIPQNVNIDLTSAMPTDGYTYHKDIQNRTTVASLKVAVPEASNFTLGNGSGGVMNAADNFELVDKNGNGVVSATNGETYSLRVKDNALNLLNNHLKAGTYNVCITLQSTVNSSLSKQVCTSIVVNKADPELKFTDTSTYEMMIGDTDFSSTITTNNLDTITASDVTFSLTNGVANILTVATDSSNPLKYNVSVLPTYAGNDLPTTYTLSASIKATDNYKAGVTTINKSIYVYKDLSALTWTPSKNNFSTTEVNASNALVGTLMAVDGVGPFTYEVVKTNDANYDPIKGANNASFTVTSTPVAVGTNAQVTTTMALSPNTYNIQFKVTDAKGNVQYTNGTISVTAKGQVALDFKDKAGGTIITTTGMKVKYDDTSSKLLAEGGSTSGAIQYAFAPQDKQPNGVNPSSYATINSSSGFISPIRVGTIKVQATRPGDSTYDPITTYMDLMIEPAPQTIEFNNKDSIVNISLGKTLRVDAVGKVTASSTSGKGGITYTSSDPSIASVDPVTGDVTGIKAGNVNIIATLNSTDASNTDFESNYDTVNTTKAVKIHDPMKLTWNPISPNLKADHNAINDSVGSILVSDNAGLVTYAISTASKPENIDASFFKVIGSGNSAQLQLNKVITALDRDNHGGTFKVQVDVTDPNGTQTIDITVQIDEADNDIYFTENGTKVTALSKVYGENGNTFELTSHSVNSGSAIYSVSTSDTSGVLSVSGTGKVTIHKAGSALVQVVIAASGGYAGGTITMPITVTLGEQAIIFKDTANLNRPFVLNTTFSEPAELKETSKHGISTRTITYASKDPSICTIDTAGTVMMLAKGTCEITASNQDVDWKSISTTKRINLYDGMGVSFTQLANLQAETVSTLANAKVGDVSVNGGMGTKTYSISSNVGLDNQDAALFKINSSGIVSFQKAIMASDLAGKYDATSKTYKLYVQIDVQDSSGTLITTNAIVEVKGAPLNALFDTDGTGKIVEEYGFGKTFTLSLSNNPGNATPTYQLKNDPTMPNDVLQSVGANGLVTILHANDKKVNSNDVIVEAVIPPSNGYDGETIEVPVEITKTNQPNFTFKSPNMKLGHASSITPTFQGQLSSGTISMSSGNNALASINGSDITSKTTDGVVVITAVESGDRDYKTATATANVTISSAPAYDFVISVPSAIYGDTGLTATIFVNEATGANQVQTWSSSDPTIADIDQSGNITIYKAGQVTITCQQTSTGEPSVSASAIFVVDPKPITVQIDDASKYVGESLPIFHATIPSVDLVGSDTISQPTFECMDGSTLVDASTSAGTYAIDGKYPTASNPNYRITIIPGTLTIKQDQSLPNWFHLEGVTSGNTLDPQKWHKEDVNVILDIASGSAGMYDEISFDKVLWGANQVVSAEGNHTKDIYFRILADHILANSQKANIKIDKTKPIIRSITGDKVTNSKVKEILNKITFGNFFKPGVLVEIKAEDLHTDPSIQTSGVANISYNLYVYDGTSYAKSKDGTLSGTKGNFTIDDTGKYKVCAIATDNAGNASDESCSALDVRSIGDDSDEDGIPDLNIDIDGDGIPDLNITKNPNDKLPWINIDTDGDQKPDMNIDVDRDGKPDLNTGIITDWVCDLLVDIDGDGKADYKTSSTLKGLNNIDSDGDRSPDINIDLDLDGLPTLNINVDGTLKAPQTNIDGDGDGIADINIDEDGDGKADKNIMEIKEWKPGLDVRKNNKIQYDTMQITFKGNDELEDNGVFVKPTKPGNAFLPNYVLKVDDVTKKVDNDTKQDILDKSGTNTEIKQVFDVNLLDGDKKIQPDGSVIIRIPMDKNIKNPRIFLQKENGEFIEVDVEIEDGYYLLETEYLGLVSIVGDQENGDLDLTNPNTNTSVKGNYTSNPIGGALTGDGTSSVLWFGVMGMALLMVISSLYLYRKNDE